MYKIVESSKVEDQWYIYRRVWFFWRLLDVRTGVARAAEYVVIDKISRGIVEEMRIRK